jgi:hypothetical protein
MRLSILAALATLALTACGADPEQDPMTADVGHDQSELAGSNPFTCSGSCIVCVQRSPDKRSCLQSARRTVLKNICSGYTTTITVLPDCAAVMPACSNVHALVGAFGC